jgi:hypothetical protein
MKKMRRKLLVLAGLVFVGSVLTAFSQPPAFAEEECPYMHFACPPDFYDCCCLKGVRCDLNAYDCERWCQGQLN